MEDFCKDKDLKQWTGGCDIDFGVADYVIFTPRNISISATNAQDLVAYLRTQAELTDENAFYPVYGQIKRVTDNSTEPTIGTLDKGYSKQLLPGRQVLLFEWPSSILNDRHIGKLNRFTGGCLIINHYKMLCGIANTDETMGAFPVEVSVTEGGFGGSGGDIQTTKMTVDLGPKDELVKTAMFYQFKDTDRIDNIYPTS